MRQAPLLGPLVEDQGPIVEDAMYVSPTFFFRTEMFHSVTDGTPGARAVHCPLLPHDKCLRPCSSYNDAHNSRATMFLQNHLPWYHRRFHCFACMKADRAWQTFKPGLGRRCLSFQRSTFGYRYPENGRYLWYFLKGLSVEVLFRRFEAWMSQNTSKTG